ncbi:MAG: nitronate monooxygenase [Bacteroidetes bacterium]|nr:nitronate monooxygenase [Bacteroidota bacterium]
MMKFNAPLNSILNIRLPIIMAPMFLVSNEKMMKSAVESGIMGVFPTLNYREKGELSAIINELHAFKKAHQHQGDFGVNLIVQKSNPLYEKHLETCASQKVPFYITSLGSPAEVIKAAHSYGANVFCDVTNIEHAEKCASLGCDGFIAVGQGAGGHAGPNPLTVLVPSLFDHFPEIPVVAAGGIANGAGIISMLALGAAGVSIGTRFIASTEAGVSNEYKEEVVKSGMGDIVLTERLSGTPCTIINTPYAKKVGYSQNWFEKQLSTNSTTKKYFKMLVQVQGMKKLEAAIKPGNYNNLWCAGKSVEMIHDILSCKQIIERLEAEMTTSIADLNKMFNC